MVSIVVPVYNEEDLIVQFHEAISKVLQGIVEGWEVVYVNDGSTDSTLELLKNLQALDPHVVVVELSAIGVRWERSLPGFAPRVGGP